ncbi:LacI family DNA-binding transcriptional regulator [Streptococcus orisratti]|uniref:LacI family DNA-binding transcriptional regulator n=1 Tax=Streptococcus orisratti TaxID=114652 RepID=UPI002A8AA319|nr:LacI family DNA-binding transcriptional regulator [Streptococcus orisratti]MDY4001116.1 LacI family DNA-binding transcriptional regulator [Streptococcus orisratti]MDY5635058.1 LacI family DNA-binding transcriptional regulator [Streptococcus orisratti]
MKKITMKDVAREAGVSVATVSYIINNREDQKISPETRNKVLQIINLLNYTPNQTAKSLVTQKSYIVALYYKEATSYLKKAEQLHFINKLSNFLHDKNYHLMCLSEPHIEKFDLADVILTLDINKDDFYRIGNANFAPLIALDSFVNDPLFFQINSDLQKLKELANTYFKGQNFTFLSLPIEDCVRRERLKEVFPSLVFIETVDDLTSNNHKNILVIDSILNHLLSSSETKLYIPNFSEEKFDKVFQAIEWASQRTEISNHNILV